MPTEWPSSTLPIANTSHFGSHGPLSAHLIGVCGAGMKALAELLDGLGWRLSGSDFSPATMAIEALVQRGLVFHHGHSAEHVPRDVECVIYSPAIPMENVERVEAARRGVPQYSYSQMVGRLMEALGVESRRTRAVGTGGCGVVRRASECDARFNGSRVLLHFL